jgi:hypothetical protein
VIAETIIPIVLDGKEYMMCFNANTMVAYEEATGKFFLDTLATLFESFKPALEALQQARKFDREAVPSTADVVDPFQVLKFVSMRDLRALLWASLHKYGADGVPQWPLTIHQVGRLITPASIPSIFKSFLQGQTANSPTKEEMGESGAPTMAPKVGVLVKSDGGASGIDLPADVFD